MAEWCAANLRDSAGWAAAGLALSTPSDQSCRLLDGAIRQMVSWRDCAQLDGIAKTLQRLKEADPDAVMTKSFLVALQAMGMDRVGHSNEQFSKEIKEMEDLAARKGNEREKKHANAAALFANGYLPEAESVWEEILAEHPNDLLAVKFAHDSYFFSGNSTGKRDSVGRVIDKWRDDEPMKSYLHGMYAFGLEECAEYEKAEKEARTGLSLRREDAWATHALAHVMEMEGRNGEGKAHLEGTVQDWEPGYILACHNFWHRALFYIDDADYETAINIFDEEVGRRAKVSHAMLDMVDAASLLWRLELEGVAVTPDRWRSLPIPSAHLHDHALAFNDVHFGLQLQRAGHTEEEKELRQSIHAFTSHGPNNNNRRVCGAVGESLYEGMQAYAEGDYEKAVERLLPVRHLIYSIGGSHAQNDVFTQTLLHACLLSGKEEMKREAGQILAERDSLRQHSSISRRLRQRLNSSNL